MSSIEQSLAEVRAVLGEIADGTTDASTRDRLRDVVSRIGSAAELRLGLESGSTCLSSPDCPGDMQWTHARSGVSTQTGATVQACPARQIDWRIFCPVFSPVGIELIFRDQVATKRNFIQLGSQRSQLALPPASYASGRLACFPAVPVPGLHQDCCRRRCDC